MSYVQSTVMVGEQIVHQSKLHWIIFIRGSLLALAGIAVIALGTEPGLGAIGGALLVFGLVSLLNAYIKRLTTELAITTRRVVVKVGLIRRTTMELNHSKVESFHVDQSLLGRLLNFGTVVVNGTGGGKTPVSSIQAPLEFRRQAMETIDTSQSR